MLISKVTFNLFPVLKLFFYLSLDTHFLHLNNEQAVRNHHMSVARIWWSLHCMLTHTHSETFRGSEAWSTIQRDIKGTKLSWPFSFISQWANILFPSLTLHFFQITFCVCVCVWCGCIYICLFLQNQPHVQVHLNKLECCGKVHLFQ